MMLPADKQLYVHGCMLIVLGLYLVWAIVKKVKFNLKVNKKIKNNAKLKRLPLFLETSFKNITRAMGKDGMVVVKSHMASMGIQPEKLTRAKTRDFLNSFVEKYASKSSYSRITEEYGSGVIDFVYANLQMKLGVGPKYNKLQKKIESKMKKISTADIKKYMAENYKGEVTDDIIRSIKESITSGVAADINDTMQQQMQMDMQNQMQQQMQMDMQMQMQNDMQNQMMLDMQMQMQQQMMMDMQMQMQQQMMMDMQMQMQNQMMMDMQHQMTMDLQNTMHQSEMAITPMHDGGHMMDMNNMHMGGM